MQRNTCTRQVETARADLVSMAGSGGGRRQEIERRIEERRKPETTGLTVAQKLGGGG
jgi:hypothetical protein